MTDNKPIPSLSIFFPAYYDEHTVEPLTTASLKVAAELSDDYEVIIVDDGSPDRTGEIADRLAKENPAHVRVVHHPQNRGVGEAMKSGYRAAKKEYVFYTDGDMQYDVAELETLAHYINGHDAVVGYRIRRAEGFFRWFTSRCFNMMFFTLFGFKFKDIDCSFKLFHRRILDRIQFRTGGALVDAETLIVARRHAVIKEIGVHHYPRKHGTSLCLKPSLILDMIRDLICLRIDIWKNPSSY
jgi:glycosyltransferase involved in cell wall biosynthesis